MMTLLFSTFFLNIFAFFNLFGIKKDLLVPQIIFYLIGLFVFFIAKKTGLHFFRNNSRFFYWFFIGLLIITYIIGLEVKGSKRWIDFYFFNFQPSEFFKIFFIIFFANYFSRKAFDMEDRFVFLKSFFYFVLPTFLIFKQPDLGNAMIFVFIYFILVVFSKIPRRFIFQLLGFFLLTLPLGWFILKDYQQNRILSFFNPHIDQSGAGYNMIQAIITAGSGKFLGKGLGFGTQSKLFFLPENHTDFAFASLVEQFGFLGGFIVILFFFIIAYVLIRKLIDRYKNIERDGMFDFLLVAGFFSYFVYQISVNIGMNLGILPVAGIALPMISYGGSSLVSFMFGLGLIF